MKRRNPPCKVVKLAPYRKGMGPTFTLYMWDDLPTGEYGKFRVAYELRMHENGSTRVLFAGDDITLSMGTCTDSDRAIAEVIACLTLKPGDTDDEFFERYTPEQLAFAEAHGEALSLACSDRFGEAP